MATYCFKKRKKDLFFEAAMRGMLAAVLDFPRCLKSRKDCFEASHQVPDAMRADVCCIAADNDAYRHLVRAGWSFAYLAIATELKARDVVPLAMVLKSKSQTSALAFLRQTYGEGEPRIHFDQAYEQYVIESRQSA